MKLTARRVVPTAATVVVLFAALGAGGLRLGAGDDGSVPVRTPGPASTLAPPTPTGLTGDASEDQLVSAAADEAAERCLAEHGLLHAPVTELPSC